MKKTTKYIIFILGLGIVKVASAQDFHFSQYDAATLYMNPALTGMYPNDRSDYKIYADYRSQWKATGIKPFSTAYIAYDQPFKKKKWKEKFGLGGYLVNQKAGAGAFNTLNVMTSVAYDIINNGEGKHLLSTGLQLGLFYKTFNPGDYTYDDQYDIALGGFNDNIPSGETYSTTGILRFDANIGVFYKYVEKRKKTHPFGGFSIQHLTKPNESFTSEKSKLPMRFNFNGGCDIAVNKELKLVPQLLYMNQGKANELNIGLLGYYKFKNPYEGMAGLSYRSKDAIIVHVGIKQENHIFRFSYDVNTSYLNNYTGGKGAWEFSLILSGKKGRTLFKSSF